MSTLVGALYVLFILAAIAFFYLYCTTPEEQ